MKRLKIMKIAAQRFRNGVSSRFCFSFSSFSECDLRMQQCFFSHFSFHFSLRWRYRSLRMQRCLRTFFRSRMSCRITRRIVISRISRRSKTVNSRHSSHMDAPKKQTLHRATLRIFFAAFQIRFFRSVHRGNRYGLFGIVDGGDGAKFSTFRGSKSRALEK